MGMLTASRLRKRAEKKVAALGKAMFVPFLIAILLFFLVVEGLSFAWAYFGLLLRYGR
jgi:pilus assembly protein TadC